MSKLIVANWKMNGSLAEAKARAAAIAERASTSTNELVICPPHCHVAAVAEAVRGSEASVGGLDCHTEMKGAFTGDVSAAMLAELGCRYIIVGHSERRYGHGETDAVVAAKAARVFEAKAIPIICVGETLADREAGQAEAVVGRQLANSLPPVGEVIVVAYEPVWSISTSKNSAGRPPTAEEVVHIHSFIRAEVRRLLPEANSIRVLYGGSAKPENADWLLALPEVDGFLVGGASLDPDSFLATALVPPLL